MALFPDFDWLSYRTDIWWYYLPRGLSYTLILYAIGGVLFSLLVQKIITYVSSAWKHYWRINDTELRPWRTNKMFQTLKKHRFLFEELVRRDFDRKYKGTAFGAVWSILNPLLSLLIMRVVFGHFFGSAIPHYTTYLFCGMVVFNFFSESTAEGMQALVGNAHIFTKVNVPKYLFLLSKNTQTLINFGITLCV